jgi:hypothetical protein
MCNTLVKMLNFNTFVCISLIYLVTAALFAMLLVLFAVGCGVHVISKVDEAYTYFIVWQASQ